MVISSERRLFVDDNDVVEDEKMSFEKCLNVGYVDFVTDSCSCCMSVVLDDVDDPCSFSLT